jgi:hypothetical protein
MHTNLSRELPLERTVLLAGYFCQIEIPKKILRFVVLVMLFLAVVFLPLYIDTKHNDVGGDAHFM